MRLLMRVAALLAALAACAPSAKAGFTVPVAAMGHASVSFAVQSYTPGTGQVGDYVTITGVGFTSATAVSFNGTAATFSITDDQHILTTVPSGATSGAVTVTTPSGSASGPTFNVTANVFAFNLDAPTLPSGLTGTRTGGTVYAATSAGTAATALTGSDIYEERDDGMHGQWTFPAYSNVIPTPTDFQTGWSTYGSPVFTTGQSDPAGGTTATKIADTTTSAVTTIWSPDEGSPGYDQIASVWVADDGVSPPTGSGAIGASDGGGGLPDIYCGILTCQDLGSGTTWRRRHSKIGTSGATGDPRILLSPSGQTPVYNNFCTQDATQTGARLFWGAMAFAGPSAGYPSFDAPTLFGSTSARVIEVNSGLLANVLDGDGDFDVEGRFFLPDIAGSQTMSEMDIFSVSAPSGVSKLYIDNSIAFYANFNGAASTSQSISYGLPGQLIEWRLWYKPTESAYGWAVRFNGAVAWVSQTSATLSSLGTPTAAYLGSSETGAANILPAMHTLLRRSARSSATAYDAEGVILGDSTSAPYSGALALMGSLIYDSADAATRRGILSLAVTGQTAAQQLTVWQASPARGNANVKWVIVQLGINDILSGADEATVKSRLNAIIADINAHNPMANVILVPTVPFCQNYTTGECAIQQALNPDIASGTGFTGSNLIFMPTWTALDNGSGTMLPQYQYTDGHNNNLARTTVEGPAFRAFLQTHGLL